MKKVLFLAVAIASVTSLSSCKKDYTCSCTYDLLGTSTTASIEIAKSSKADATTACDAETTSLQTYDSAASCTLAAK